MCVQYVFISYLSFQRFFNYGYPCDLKMKSLSPPQWEYSFEWQKLASEIAYIFFFDAKPNQM